jgi:hypothetical protein
MALRRTVVVVVTEIGQHPEELAYRKANGIEVSLLWSRAENSITVVCVDARTEERFTVAADPADALDVFRHPYAYAARRCRDDCAPALAA